MVNKIWLVKNEPPNMPETFYGTFEEETTADEVIKHIESELYKANYKNIIYLTKEEISLFETKDEFIKEVDI